MDEKKELFRALTRLTNLIFWIILITYIFTFFAMILAGVAGFASV